jgi:hypothetical protein
MGTLYTKEGRPLRQSGNDLFSSSGIHVARFRGKKAYGPDGRYVGTLVGDRLAYRCTDGATVGSAFAQRAGAGTARACGVGSAICGEEPPIPD